MNEMDPATVLEEAADLLLIRGVARDGSYGNPGGPRCALGALAEASGIEVDQHGFRPGSSLLADLSAVPGAEALGRTVGGIWQNIPHANVPAWNDGTVDDFEVIDTLRRVAKDLRNGENP